MQLKVDKKISVTNLEKYNLIKDKNKAEKI
jgi:hypothetical protein